MAGKQSTNEVAKSMGVSKAKILMALSRHPELKPAQQFGQMFVWSDSEVTRLAAHLGSHKAGRPAKK